MTLTELKTQASFRLTESVNRLPFNTESYVGNCSKLPASSVPMGLVREQAHRYFETLCSKPDPHTELCEIMKSEGSDKAIYHNYTILYDAFFGSLRNKGITFAEVGLGTNNQDVVSHMRADYPVGASLSGWVRYFGPFAKIVGGDIDERILFEREGMVTDYIDQLDPDAINGFFTRNEIAEQGADVILDDGLHRFHANICLLLSSWKFLKPGGLYIIEDILKSDYERLCNFLESLALGADMACFELPSLSKEDNRVVCLQKTSRA